MLCRKCAQDDTVAGNAITVYFVDELGVTGTLRMERSD